MDIVFVFKPKSFPHFLTQPTTVCCLESVRRCAARIPDAADLDSYLKSEWSVGKVSIRVVGSRSSCKRTVKHGTCLSQIQVNIYLLSVPINPGNHSSPNGCQWYSCRHMSLPASDTSLCKKYSNSYIKHIYCTWCFYYFYFLSVQHIYRFWQMLKYRWFRSFTIKCNFVLIIVFIFKELIFRALFVKLKCQCMKEEPVLDIWAD